MTVIGQYLAFGALWIGTCVLLGGIRVRQSSVPIGAALMLMVLFWPYLLFRMIANVASGNPNGSVWP